MNEAQDPQTNAIPNAGARHLILGTAGHIDHGKTSLIKALTGTDTDRLPEERRRGMTIELGFAHLELDDLTFGVVDVPGHERFVRTMVAGATGIDVALIVVAADDSVMPQTREHFDILNLLGVTHGVVAITKCDLVPDDMAELVAEEVMELIGDTPLRDAPICRVSSTTGAGLDDLKAAIIDSAHKTRRPSPAQPFRLAIDRVFTVQGRGTVVTGSALRGIVGAGESLEVWPSGASCRVRALQTHGHDSEVLSGGQRVAMNVSGIDRDVVERGCEMATPGYLHACPMIDVRLELLRSESRPLKSTTTVRLGIGTVETPVRVVLLDRKELTPGESAFAQLRAGVPLTATHGQRFIIRDESATRTLGGGIVLRPVARRRRRKGDQFLDGLGHLESQDPRDRVGEVLRDARFVRPTDLQICARAGVEVEEVPAILERLQNEKRYNAVPGTEVFAVPAALDDLAARLLRWLERYHEAHPDKPGRHADAALGWLERMTSKPLAKPLYRHLEKKSIIKPFGQFVCAPKFAPQLTKADEKLLSDAVDEIRKGGFSPPLPDGLSCAKSADRKRMARLVTLAVAMGDLVSIDGKIYLHSDVENELRTRVAALIRQAGGVTVAEVRESLDSSRKFVVPYLEYLDRIEWTRRDGDRRVLGGAAAGAASTTNGCPNT